jgi:TrmH family RNA methyltransferase
MVECGPMSSPQFERITSSTNATLKALRKLVQEAGAYREQGRLWLEGDHLLQAALKRGLSLQLAVIGERTMLERPELRLLAERAPRVLVVDDAVFDAISGLKTPLRLGGCVAWQEQAIASGLPSVVLDRLQDAGNVGSILRSAAALGIRQVVALKGTAHLGSAKVLRAGMGAHFALRLVEGASSDQLQELGVPLLATSSYANEALGDRPLPQPAAWVFGHEGQGVSEALLARCERQLRIPQPGGEESLNAAAAAAICLYEFSRSAGPA